MPKREQDCGQDSKGTAGRGQFLGATTGPFLVKCQNSGYIARSHLDPQSSNYKLSKTEKKSNNYKNTRNCSLVNQTPLFQREEDLNMQKVTPTKKTSGLIKGSNLQNATNTQEAFTSFTNFVSQVRANATIYPKLRGGSSPTLSSVSQDSQLDIRDMNIGLRGSPNNSSSKVVSCVVSRRASNSKMLAPRVSRRINENSSDGSNKT